MAIPGHGQTLGIEGSAQTGPDLTTVQPDIDATGNAVQVGWGWGWGWGGNTAFLDRYEIQVDCGSGWVLLAFDTTPNYSDTAPMPAAPAKWKYRAIYHVGDLQVGVWSNTVEIMVG